MTTKDFVGLIYRLLEAYNHHSESALVSLRATILDQYTNSYMPYQQYRVLIDMYNELMEGIN